jgi:hypothetical protein
MGGVVGPEQIVSEILKVSLSKRKDDRFQKVNLTSVAKNFLVIYSVYKLTFEISIRKISLLSIS